MDYLGSCCVGWWGIVSQSARISRLIFSNFINLSLLLGDLTENYVHWDTWVHNEISVNSHTLPVASWGFRELGRGGRGCALTGGWGEMVQIITIGSQCGVVRMAKTDASEGALEAGKFLCKGQKGRAPPFEEDVSSQGILLSGEAMHKGSIIEDCNGDLESRNDSRNFSSVVNSIAQDSEEGEFPFIQSLSGFFGTHANAGSKCEGEQMFVRCWKCGCDKHLAEIFKNIVEDWQKDGALETKFQAKVFRLRDEVGLSKPRKKHPSSLEGWTHLELCDGNCDDWGNARGSCHGE